ncbi:MAG: hypothetical protein HRT87_09055, partial [Legionellales bacterium]|nr:hypothetical protein [Legionellales bacterium]
MPTATELFDEQLKIALKTNDTLKYLTDYGVKPDRLFEIALNEDNPLGYLESQGVNNDQLKEFIFKNENKEIKDKFFSELFNFQGNKYTDLFNEQLRKAIDTGDTLKYIKKQPSTINKFFEIALNEDNPLEYLESHGVNNDQLNEYIFQEVNEEIRDKLYSKIFNFSGSKFTDAMRTLIIAFPIFNMEGQKAA